VTLACRDIDRMAAFYRQFGWPEASTRVQEHVVFQCANGVALGLFSETVLEGRHGRIPDGFRGITLGVMLESPTDGVAAHGLIVGFDDVHDEPSRSGWGCGFSFGDPEGNVWEVAHKYGSEIDAHGGYLYPLTGRAYLVTFAAMFDETDVPRQHDGHHESSFGLNEYRRCQHAHHQVRHSGLRESAGMLLGYCSTGR